ncbi:UDP-2,4-diacetamido-2,4,6-trideoxy-beta-L-altropyranose hydrolase [Chitinophaga sp. YIM B06452]|uniref:UDP-2,4-diacetamido-2,4, 6-trideoxy-beta-L-altropyranose hydrolase n=1 Tax=Chitinophaga sp. YIM B06452 TaxID=3082158 RepID=UPI0031FE791E
MPGRTKILFRCDGGPQIGLGHVIRSCALAMMLREEFECRFFIRNPSPALGRYVEEAGFALTPLPGTGIENEAAAWAEQLEGNEILVLDGYAFNTYYQQQLKARGNKIVCIDDIHAYHFVADAVINHAGGLSVQDYSLAPLTRAYLGTAYALLRPAFLQQDVNGAREEAIMVSMGGADPKNDTMAVLELLRQKGIRKKCYVVTGSAYLHREALETYVRQHEPDIELLQNLDEQAMAALMRRCRWAICPPSTVSYEYLSIHGELYLQMIADNQQDIYNFFTRENLAFPLRDIFVDDAEKLAASAAQQVRFFDGQSPQRLLKIFRQLDLERSLSIRRVTAADSEKIFEWANEPAVRQHSLNQAEIKAEEHEAWFSRKIIAPDAHMYILELEGKPVGQIRFDIDIMRSQAAIGYSVDADFRGRGLGTAVTRLGISAFRAARPDITEIKAVVKTTNAPSRQVFEQLNFLKHEETIQGQPCHVYLLKFNTQP